MGDIPSLNQEKYSLKSKKQFFNHLERFREQANKQTGRLTFYRVKVNAQPANSKASTIFT